MKLGRLKDISCASWINLGGSRHAQANSIIVGKLVFILLFVFGGSVRLHRDPSTPCIFPLSETGIDASAY